MKKVYLSLVVLSLILSSCFTYHWQIGQSSQEFFEMNKHHQLDVVKSSTDMTIYQAGTGDNTLFFYFQYNKLIEVDHGVANPNIIIENRNR